MSFVVTGLDPHSFTRYFGLSDTALAEHGVVRMNVEDRNAYPDRIELRDLEPGEHALLLNHVHQPADTPFRASHAIFVREGASAAASHVDEMPPSLASRLLSIRAFSAAHMMVGGDVIEGGEAPELIARMLEDPQVDYLHAHYARRGCYAALIRRA